MRLLLDTQIVLWFLEQNPALPTPILRSIQDASNEILISRVSLFEIAIKLKIGKLTLTRGLMGLIDDCQEESLTIIPVTDKQLLAYNEIPFHDDHRDPFDRLILATALAEGMAVVSADEKFMRYRNIVDVIW